MWFNLKRGRDYITARYPSSPPPVPAGKAPISLTVREKGVLLRLADAWNEFVDLVDLDGSHPDDAAEFRAAIHAAQNIIACRVAKRADPDQWWQDKKGR